MLQKSIPMFTPEQTSAKSCFAISEEKGKSKRKNGRKSKRKRKQKERAVHRGLDMNNEEERRLEKVASTSIGYLLTTSQKRFSDT